MRKSNFKLTKDNWKFFVYRFNKMLNKTGAVSSQGFYTGRKPIKTMVKKFSKRLASFVTDKTSPSFIAKEYCLDGWRISYRENGIVLSQGGVMSFEIKFGTKMYLTPEKIEWKNNIGSKRDSRGCSHIFKSADAKRAKNFVKGEIEYDKAYWKDYEKELTNFEFEGF